MNKIHWIEMRPEEFIEARDKMPIAYLPLGTLEWHGYHLPLGADGIQSEALFEHLANKIGGIVMPMLFLGPDRVTNDGDTYYYGMDNYRENRMVKYDTQVLPGSAYWVDDEFFDEMIMKIAKNIKRMGFKILVGHGHGPSSKHFMKLKDRVQEEIGLTLVCGFEYRNDDELTYQSDHAAHNETSITWAVREDLVDITRLKDEKDLKALIGKNPIEYASKEYGQKVLDYTVEMMSEKLLELIKTIK